MKRMVACLCLLACCLVSVRADPPPEIGRLNEAYQKGLAKIADEYNAGLTTVAEDYLIELKKLSARLKTQKDKAGMAAVRQEVNRYLSALRAEPDPFETVPELTDENLVKEPLALRELQRSYVAARTAKELQRNEDVGTLTGKLLGGLDKLREKNAENEEVAAAFKKEANRIRVAMQRKDFAPRTLKENNIVCRVLPPEPDVSRLKERMDTALSRSSTSSISGLNMTELPPHVQTFLLKPMDYDPKWPPEITKWKFEGTGNYSHDYYLYNQHGIPAEFGIFPHAKTMRAYIRGTKQNDATPLGSRTIRWTGKAMAWLLKDSRDLVCTILFRTQRPSLSETEGPAACVAVYSVNEGDKLIASYSIPMTQKTTELYVAKHYSYNRMNIKWVGTKRKRGFTIPDHMPMRVVIGVVGFAKGEEIDATIEILPARQNEEM